MDNGKFLIAEEFSGRYYENHWKDGVPFLQKLNVLLEDSNITILKQNKYKVEIVYPVLHMPGNKEPLDSVHIKVCIYSLNKKIRNLFCASRAKKSWIAASLLFKEGFDTPQAVAYREEWDGFGIGLEYDYYITEYLPNCKNIKEFIRDCKREDTMVFHFLRGLSFEVARLHNKKIIHGDLKAGNVLVNAKKNVSFYFTDLDRLRQKFFLTFYDITKDFAALYSSLVDLLSEWEAECFMKFYLEYLSLLKPDPAKFKKKVLSITEKRNKIKRR